jgi:hypothetical protein
MNPPYHQSSRHEIWCSVLSCEATIGGYRHNSHESETRWVLMNAFDNRPSSSQPDTKPLSRGRKFHANVQTAFLAGLVGTTATPEKTITLSRTRGGRVDLLVVPQGGEAAAVVVEIKSTDWDALADHRVRPNLRSHLRQLQRYLDVYVADLRQEPRTGDPDHDPIGDHPPSRWDSVAGVLLYRRRPNDQSRAQLVEELADREALMVVWYSETDWQHEDEPTSHDPR